jgi:hypothetical protein
MVAVVEASEDWEEEETPEDDDDDWEGGGGDDDWDDCDVSSLGTELR